jgi:hypothetical protein
MRGSILGIRPFVVVTGCAGVSSGGVGENSTAIEIEKKEDHPINPRLHNAKTGNSESKRTDLKTGHYETVHEMATTIAG